MPTIVTRATEYSTPQSMPAELPKVSGYTYCAELSVDGAQRVRFAKPVVTFIENFLGFAVGQAVPLGYYDRDRGEWIAEPNGLVVRLLDSDGDGVVDGLDKNSDGPGSSGAGSSGDSIQNSMITTVAGSGASGYSGDGGLAKDARITLASGITFDHCGNFYFSQFYGNGDVVRKVTSNGYISTVACAPSLRLTAITSSAESAIRATNHFFLNTAATMAC
jgi:hypothetical protein